MRAVVSCCLLSISEPKYVFTQKLRGFGVFCVYRILTAAIGCNTYVYIIYIFATSIIYSPNAFAQIDSTHRHYETRQFENATHCAISNIGMPSIYISRISAYWAAGSIWHGDKYTRPSTTNNSKNTEMSPTTRFVWICLHFFCLLSIARGCCAFGRGIQIKATTNAKSERATKAAYWVCVLYTKCL